MELRRIKEASYEVLSKDRDQVLTKNRGYGVVHVNAGDITFALPLRSNLNHPHGFKTVLDRKSRTWNGIDYTKALVVTSQDLEDEAFKTRDLGEYKKIKRNAEKIKKEFFNYVSEYIMAIKAGGELDRKFAFTTLQYFHKELGL